MNLQSYVESEFARFDEKPFNELDAAVFTQLAMVRSELAASVQGGFYLRDDGVLLTAEDSETLCMSLRDLLCAECFDALFTGLAASQVKACLLAAAMSPRYRDIRIIRYQTVLDAGEEVQFSATTFSCPFFTFIGFRGTDASLVGWREDFNLAHLSPVPAQVLGRSYAEIQLAQDIHQPVYLGGHSKGGNIAEYVMLALDEAQRCRIATAYNFDGPGFKENAFPDEQFYAIAPRFHKLVPQDSIFGMILDSASAVSVVKSVELGLLQHNLFSWEIEGSVFVRRAELTPASLTIDAATRGWIHSYSDAEIREFVQALFDAADASGALDVQTLFGGGMLSVQYLRAAASQVDSQRAEILKRFASDLAEALGASVASQANDAIKTARDQVEGRLRAARDTLLTRES